MHWQALEIDVLRLEIKSLKVVTCEALLGF